MANDLIRVRVRCCCTPGLVLGTIELPRRLVRAGTTLRVPTMEGSMADGYRRGELLIEFEEIQDPTGREVAIKSNEIPIETWRRIESFREYNRPMTVDGHDPFAPCVMGEVLDEQRRARQEERRADAEYFRSGTRYPGQ